MRVLLGLLMAVVMSSCVPVMASDPYPPLLYTAELERVVDGDTMDLTLNLGLGVQMDVRVRIKDFDTPETWRPKTEAEKAHGEAATAYAEQLLTSQPWRARVYEWAVFNRVEVDIVFDDGTDYTDHLREHGFEKREWYPPDE